MKVLSPIYIFLLRIVLLFTNCPIAYNLSGEFNNQCRNLAGNNCSEILRTENPTRKTIYFGLMLSFPDTTIPPQREYSNYDDGHDIAPAVFLAVKQINNRSDILKDYEVKLKRFDGGCDVESRTAVGFNELVCSCETIVGIIGPSCEKSATFVSRLSNKPNFSMLSLNYGGNETSVGGNPYSFGLLGEKSTYAEVVDCLLRRNNWSNPAILFTGSIYSVEVEHLNSLSGEAYNFSYSSSIQENFIPLKELRENFIRIIIVFAPPETILRILCLAYHEDMMFPDYQWILPELSDRDLDTDSISFEYANKFYKCNDAELREGFNGSIGVYFATSPQNFSDKDTKNAHYNIGVKAEEYCNAYRSEAAIYSKEFSVMSNTSQWALPLYNAVWVLAIALNNTLPDFNYSLAGYETGSKVLADRLKDRISKTNMIGVSGLITFDASGYNTHASLSIFQFGLREGDTTIPKTKIAIFYDHEIIFLTVPNFTVQFVSNKFPEIHPDVNLSVATVLFAITSLSLLLVLSAQIINICYRDHKVVRASSPTLNHLIFLGCYMVILGIIFQVINTFLQIESNLKEWFCNFVPSLHSVGITLFIGTVCIKTWRLNRLYAKSRQLKRGQIKWLNNTFLALFVSLLVVVDVFVCILWSIIDPLKIEVTNTPALQGNETVLVVTEDCRSSEDKVIYWLVVLMSPKILLTLASFLLALSTNMSKKEFKTSNVIILTYLLATMFGIAIPIFTILHFKKVILMGRIIMLSICLNVSVCVCVVVLFLPFICDVMKKSVEFCGR